MCTIGFNITGKRDETAAQITFGLRPFYYFYCFAISADEHRSAPPPIVFRRRGVVRFPSSETGDVVKACSVEFRVFVVVCFLQEQHIYLGALCGAEDAG